METGKRQTVALIGGFLMFAVLITAFPGGMGMNEARAAHSDYMGGAQGCDACHNLAYTAVDPTPYTSYILNSKLMEIKGLNAGTTPDLMPCTFCHSYTTAARRQFMTNWNVMKEERSQFTGTEGYNDPKRHHPVDRSYDLDDPVRRNVNLYPYEVNNITMSPWLGSDPYRSWTKPASQMACTDCHDVSLYTAAYPDHPALWNADNTPITSSSRYNNPFMLRNVTSWTWSGAPSQPTGNAPDSFCLQTCHNSTFGPATKMGHYGWGAYGLNGNVLREPGGTPLKKSSCVDCHEVHFSGNTTPGLMGEGRSSNNTIDDQNCTSICHDDTNWIASGHKKGLAANYTCSSNCHTTAVSHREAANPLRLSGGEDAIKSDLSTNVASDNADNDYNGLADDAGESAFRRSRSSNCNNCHQEHGYHKGKIVSATDKSAACTDCHDPHGKGVFNGTDNNAYMIRATVIGKNTVYRGKTDFYTVAGTGVCDNPNCHGKPLGPKGTAGTIMEDVAEHRTNVTVTFNSDCTICHSHSGPGPQTSFAPNCNGCHDYAGQPHKAGAHVLSPVHDKHYKTFADNGYEFSCSSCHMDNIHNESIVSVPTQWGDPSHTDLMISNNVQVKFDGLNPAGTYSPAAGSRTAPAAGTCSNLRCHGATLPANAKGTNQTPSWDWNQRSTGACGTCHRVYASALKMATGAHRDHADSAAGYGFGCNTCHYETTPDGLTIPLTSARSFHIDNSSRVTFNTSDWRFTGAGAGSYTGTTTIGDAGGTCTNVYCHSKASAKTNPYGGLVVTPGWDNTTALACSACHDAPPAYTSGTPKANTHAKHSTAPAAFGCQVCHWRTTQDGTSVPQSGKASHVNGEWDAVSEGDVAANPGATAKQLSHNFAYDNSLKTCNSAACHGGWLVGNPNVPAWGGGTIGCQTCHSNSAGVAVSADTDEFVWDNGVMSKVHPGEYGGLSSGAGHGRSGSAYASGRAAAGFAGPAPDATGCLYCHTTGVGHGDSTNRFRLANKGPASGVQDNGWNNVCLQCHATGGAGFNPGTGYGSKDATSTFVDDNHYGYKHTAGTMGGTFCWDCHDPHGDTNAYMTHSGDGTAPGKGVTSVSDGVFGIPTTSRPVWVGDVSAATGGGYTSADLVASTTNSVVADGTYQGLCQTCHAASGGANYYRRNLYTALTGHNGADTQLCTSCHSHNAGFSPSCNGCHGEASALSGAPPFAPFGGNRIWPSTVDNYAVLAGLGNHRSRPASGVDNSGHDPFTGATSGCVECHTNTPGGGATHNQATNVNAPMTNISNHNWYAGAAASWSRGTLDGGVAGGSVVDDSCSNINCHSPYYGTPANQYKSGTPAPYTRYWLNMTLWDCYTCHAYDGRTATSRPAGADNTISTGMHSRHVGTLQYACSRCHDVTGYSAASLTGNHKNGFVNWSFAGSLNPYGSTPSYSVATGSAAPTDDNAAAGHRSWGSCSNLYCHSIGQKATGAVLTGAAGEYLVPAWDNVLSGQCGSCHRSDGVQGTATWMDSAGHNKHLSLPYRNYYTCSTCHNGLGSGASSHVDNQVNLAFGTTLNGTTIGATYNQGNTHPVGNGLGTCTATYCHGTGTPALTGGANQAGVPNVPAWGTASTALCGSCHGGYGGAVNYPGKASNYPTSGAHARHMNDLSGPMISACYDCHASTHADGKVDFRTRYDNTTATTFALTQTCDPCHGTGVATAKANWNTVGLVDCLTCHGSTAAYTNANATGRVAPNVGGDNSTYGANVRGHNRPTASGVYPVTSNPAANRTCEHCHNLSIAHIDGTDNTTYAGNRLWDNVNGVSGISTVSGMCAACHTTSGSSPATKKGINTHGNAGYPGRLEAVFTALSCNQCHEPHGMVNVSAAPAGLNLWMINPTITVATGVTSSPVRLFAKSGANSFDSTGTASDICRVCHANTSNPGYPMAYNVGGQHAAPGYAGNETGKDCSSCHSHNQDGAIGTVDGLMPLECNGCHSYPGLDNTGANLKQMSVGHWKHVGQPLPVGDAANNKGFDCTLCHYNYTHNESGLAKGQAWPAAYFDNVNVNFDPSWNPGSTTYRGLAVPTTGNGGTGACAGLYCHGGNATLNPGWAGSSTSPAWNGTLACGTCHDTGIADTTPGTLFSTKNHPVHIDNVGKPYGPETWRFSVGTNCSEGTGCHTRYDLTPGGLHVNNAKDLRSTPSDNGYVAATLATTQVCRNCHSTYTSVSIPVSGDAQVRTQANWDNPGYFVDCLTCHNGTAAGTQATARIDGSGGVAAAIEGTISTMGHGTAGIGCGWCHGDIGHLGANRPVSSNPYRLTGYFFTGTYPPITTLGGIDYICNYCHAMFGPPDHTWRVSGSGAYGPEAKGAADTHPTTVLGVGTDKDRWYQLPSSPHIPLYGDLMDNNYNRSGGTNNYVLCVSCHDPHGVGASAVPSSVRRFSGQNTDPKGTKALRFNYSVGAPTALCSQCHK